VAGGAEGCAEVEPAGTLTLKGFLKPVEVFNVLGMKQSA
jgi:hypothetical protein